MVMRGLWLVLLAAASLPLNAADFQERFTELAADKSLSAEAKLHQLFDLDWELGLHNYPEFATYLGIEGSDDRWTDQSWEAIQKRQAEQQWPLAVIKTINRSELTPADQLNYDLFLRNIEEGIANDKFPGELLVVSQLGGCSKAWLSNWRKCRRANPPVMKTSWPACAMRCRSSNKTSRCSGAVWRKA